MDIQELEKLADWYVDHFAKLNTAYQALISPIQHNATQPNKQPVDAELENLISYLRGMDFNSLSLQQIKMLERLGVDRFIGNTGAEYLESVIRTSNYDPATALDLINLAYSEVTNTRNQLEAYNQALLGLKIRDASLDEGSDLITIRIGFQNDAAINNVTDWKESAKDWFDIIRGLALASNESPEDTHIIGATTGSIILILAGTTSVTTLLAIISKHVTGVAKNVIETLSAKEGLRTKRLLNDIIEAEFHAMIAKQKADALETVMAEVEPLLADKSGDKIPALRQSVEKLLAFNEKGGNVDFVEPPVDEAKPETEGNEEAATQAGNPEIAEARKAIREFQAVREELKLLSHHTIE